MYCFPDLVLWEDLATLHLQTTVPNTKKYWKYMVWYAFDRLWFITGTMYPIIFSSKIILSNIYEMFRVEVCCQTFFGSTLETVWFIKNLGIHFNTITLESDVTFGTNYFVGIGSFIGRSSMVKPLSRVSDCTNIPRDAMVTVVYY